MKKSGQIQSPVIVTFVHLPTLRKEVLSHDLDPEHVRILVPPSVRIQIENPHNPSHPQVPYVLSSASRDEMILRPTCHSRGHERSTQTMEYREFPLELSNVLDGVSLLDTDRAVPAQEKSPYFSDPIKMSLPHSQYRNQHPYHDSRYPYLMPAHPHPRVHRHPYLRTE